MHGDLESMNADDEAITQDKRLEDEELKKEEPKSADRQHHHQELKHQQQLQTAFLFNNSTPNDAVHSEPKNNDEINNNICFGSTNNNNNNNNNNHINDLNTLGNNMNNNSNNNDNNNNSDNNNNDNSHLKVSDDEDQCSNENVLSSPSCPLHFPRNHLSNPVFPPPFSFFSYFKQHISQQPNKLLPHSFNTPMPTINLPTFSTLQTPDGFSHSPFSVTLSSSFSSPHHSILSPLLPQQAFKQDHLSNSYNFIARQLHDTECHVIKLRKVLKEIRGRLVDFKSQPLSEHPQSFSRSSDKDQSVESLKKQQDISTLKLDSQFCFNRHPMLSSTLTDVATTGKVHSFPSFSHLSTGHNFYPADIASSKEQHLELGREGSSGEDKIGKSNFEEARKKGKSSSSNNSDDDNKETPFTTPLFNSFSELFSSQFYPPSLSSALSLPSYNAEVLMGKIENKLSDNPSYKLIQQAIRDVIAENCLQFDKGGVEKSHYDQRQQQLLFYNQYLFNRNIPSATRVKNHSSNNNNNNNNSIEGDQHVNNVNVLNNNTTNNNINSVHFSNYNIFIDSLKFQNLPSRHSADFKRQAFGSKEEDKEANKDEAFEEDNAVRDFDDDNVIQTSHKAESNSNDEAKSNKNSFKTTCCTSNASNCACLSGQETLENNLVKKSSSNLESGTGSCVCDASKADDVREMNNRESFNQHDIFNNSHLYNNSHNNNNNNNNQNHMNNNCFVSESITGPKDSPPSVQSLDTAEVSQRIREILSAHNIGQRLFARHVLGLSQGTVSELLSKPKHWDKLTEKGRESYRRMYLWAGDRNNIATLKSFAPKKGSNAVMANSEMDVAETEEKIVQILSEAKVAMQIKNNESKDEASSAMVANIYYQELSRLEQNSAQENEAFNGSSKNTQLKIGELVEKDNYASDVSKKDISRDMVAQMYQEELKKLAMKTEVEGNKEDSEVYRREIMRINDILNQNNNQNFKNNLYLLKGGVDFNNNFGINRSQYFMSPVKQEANNNDIRNNSNERKKSFNFLKSMKEENTPQDLRVHKESACSMDLPEMSKNKFTNTNSDEMRAFGGPQKSKEVHNNQVSPLQQMQTIASSLLVKSQKPLRAVLPPITHEQLEKYSKIETEELVKKVKDLLSQFSISQRLFGEMVLGLSQGSVSDLLARPKPWLMLTQKGREPFIRMQIFLDDDTAVSKLVAAQFQTPSEKLMRMSNKNQQENKSGEAVPNFQTMHAMHNARHNLLTKYSFLNHDPYKALRIPSVPNPTFNGNQNINYFLEKSMKYERPYEMNSDLQFQPNQPPLYFSRSPSYPINFYQRNMLIRMPQFAAINNTEFPSPRQFPKPPQEATQDLDTFEITSKIKEVLQFHNIGQKLFGEAVLGLSQGSVSELLSKPKAWHMLSLKGREPFFKMHLWLIDPLSVSKLKLYQEQMRTKKRKLSDDMSLGDFQQKKTRMFFSEEQKSSLKEAYATDPYPNQSTLEELACGLGVATKTVINWFHNYRMRIKQQINTSSSQASFNCQNSSSSSEDKSEFFNYFSEDDKENADFEITVDDDISPETSFSQGLVTYGNNNFQEGSSEQESFVEADEALCVKEESSETLSKICKHQILNKRKSNKPQWLFEGTHLDRSLQDAGEFSVAINEEAQGLDGEEEEKVDEPIHNAATDEV